MTKRNQYILVFIILALVAAVFTWKITFKKSQTSVASEKVDVEIGSAELLQEYETDENAANAKYLDKIVIVTGTIASITEDSLGISIYLKDSDATSGIICSFDKNIFDVSTVQAGLVVSIKGVCTGYLMDVVLNKCALTTATR